MDEELLEHTPEEEEEGNTPRPAWQVWGARIALVLFLAILVVYYVTIARGGM